MNRYENIVALGDNFMKLVQQKLIPIHVPAWKAYYEAYMEEKKTSNNSRVKISKTEIASNIAGRFNITERTLYNVIAFMEGE